jgi:hypothetical protein
MDRAGRFFLGLVIVGALGVACVTPSSTSSPSASVAPRPTPPPSLFPGQTISTSQISAEAAASTAIGQVSSTIPVTVVSTTLSTYGANSGGGAVAGADTPVWAVLLSGSFGFPSCGPITPTPHPCPSPATSELVLIDARTGAFIEGLMPAPSPS